MMTWISVSVLWVTRYKVTAADLRYLCVCVCVFVWVWVFSNPRQDGREDSFCIVEVRTLFSIRQRKGQEQHNGKMHTLCWWKASVDRKKFHFKF